MLFGLRPVVYLYIYYIFLLLIRLGNVCVISLVQRLMKL